MSPDEERFHVEFSTLPWWQRWLVYIVSSGAMLLLLFAILLLVGKAIDVNDDRSMRLRMCQKNALTPYDYAQCQV